MGLFGKKKLRVDIDDISNYFCVRHKKSNKKLKLNTQCIVPDDCVCVFCYYDKPCDVLKTGEYELNGNSLPVLYKKGKFNKPNKRNYIPNYFYANIFFASTNNVWIEFDIDKFKVKDRVYGNQKINFSFKINIKINDALKFFKSLLYQRPHISTRGVIPELAHWFKTDIRKYLKRQGYNIDDYMCYTRGFNAELQTLLADRFVSVGIEITETILEDIQMSDELVREINDNRRLSYEIHSSLKDFDIAVNNDGYKTSVDFARSREQLEGSLAESNQTPKQDDSITMDDEDIYSYDNVSTQNMYSDTYLSAKYDEIEGNILNAQNQSYVNLQDTTDNTINSMQNAQNLQDIENVDLEEMYKVAEETMASEDDAFSTLYGQNTSFKICSKCEKQVPYYLSTCPYCGHNDFNN